jgi:hypothetical protein
MLVKMPIIKSYSPRTQARDASHYKMLPLFCVHHPFDVWCGWSETQKPRPEMAVPPDHVFELRHAAYGGQGREVMLFGRDGLCHKMIWYVGGSDSDCVADAPTLSMICDQSTDRYGSRYIINTQGAIPTFWEINYGSITIQVILSSYDFFFI